MSSLSARFLSRAATVTDNSSNTGQSDDADSFMDSTNYDLPANRGSDDNESLPEGILHQSPSTHQEPAFAPVISSGALKEFSKTLAGNMKLSEKDAKQLEDFAMMLDAEQRIAQFAISLEIRAIVQELKRDEEYKIPDDFKIIKSPSLLFLKANIKNYSRAAPLSPTITSYRGNIADTVIDAMGELNVHNLPDQSDSARVKKVLSEIGRVLTIYRSAMKNKLKASLEVDSSTKNIADLTHALIGDTPVQPTLDHYIRFAFLRDCLAGDASAEDAPATAASDDQFWLMVDNTIEELRKACKTEKEIKDIFLLTFEEDKSKYGAPETSGRKAVEQQALPQWQKVVAKCVKGVLGVKTAKKRKTK
ncbi:hypothetical protein CVT26_015187 [Gymnopilus dilepis]|uniref:Uncharacterized protein n=1 Tax=Gymnopilus dilepis TaxID=231916 RepID=A0A409WA06_9AGAR|nr:hypothetical protein CVT26_015187 [Gymnopilus dilepis]